MPPKENDMYIGWTTREGEAIGKVKYSELSNAGFTCELELTDIKKEDKNMELKNVDYIRIDRDGDQVIARAFSKYRNSYGYRIVREAAAKCGPNDIFDFNIGAKLALDRLYEGYDMTPKPKRKPYNGKIFIQRFPGSILLPNHIYNVRNGVIANIPLIDRHRPFIFADMTDVDMSVAVYKNLYSECDSDLMAACCSGCYFVKE